MYQGDVWKIRVELADAYPFKSPSVDFITKIYHPNVDELPGSVCLEVCNHPANKQRVKEYSDKYAKSGKGSEDKSSDEEFGEKEYSSDEDGSDGVTNV